MGYEAQLEAKQARRMHAQSRYLARLEKLERRAAPLIGELCREGRTVYYVVTARGTVRESASHSELVDYMIRNRYVA